MNWILVPLRNNLHYIRKALPTFLAQDIGVHLPDFQENTRILLLDNGSTDGTPQWANSLRNDRVVYIYNVTPMSVAASWNAMLRWTFKQGAEYALVVNADTLLRPDTYRLLVEDGSLFVTAVGTDDKSKIDPPYHVPDPAKKRPHPDFSAYLIRKECFARMGPFNEECLGGYVEDGFAHVAMHKAGIEAVCLDLPFYHVGAGTLKTADPREAKRIRENADRNRALFKAKHGVEVGSPQYYELFGHGAPE